MVHHPRDPGGWCSSASGRKIGNEWGQPGTGPRSTTGTPAPPPTPPRATELHHHSPTDAALSTEPLRDRQ